MSALPDCLEVNNVREMKDSGIEWIGTIPYNWGTSKLLYCLRQPICDGPHETPTYVDDGIPFISVDSLNDSKNIDFSIVKRFISQEAYNLYQTKAQLEKGDILFSKAATIGKTAIVGDDIFMIWSPLAIIKPNEQLIYRDYLYYILNCEGLITAIRLSGSFNTQANVGMREMERAIVPVPPIGKQREVAAFLDRKCAEFDQITADIQVEIETLEAIRTSVISEAVTHGLDKTVPMRESGAKWCRTIPAHWEMVPSKYLFHNSDLRKQEGDEQLTASQKYGIITQEDYMERENASIVLANKGLEDWKHIEPYDFVISLRSFQGGLEMSEVTGCITWHYVVLKPSRPICHRFYKWLFKSAQYINALQGTCNFIRDGQDLRFSNFAQVPLFVPPLEEQEAVADYLDGKCAELDAAIAAKREQLTTLEEYKKSLIFEYVTGKKEVPVA